MNIRVLTLLSCWLLASVAVAQSVPPATDLVPPIAQTTTAAPATSAISEEEAASYIIGPGDELQVFVWRNPELSTTVPVRPDGKVSTPLVNDMVAVGKTPAELQRDIEKALGEYIRSPQVSVILTEARSTFSSVRVVGEVKKPQAVAYRSGMTVLDVLLEAGGLNEFAAGNRAKLIRKEGGKDVDIRVKLDDLMNDGDMGQNLPVKPGDVLIVPESRW